MTSHLVSLHICFYLFLCNVATLTQSNSLTAIFNMYIFISQLVMNIGFIAAFPDIELFLRRQSLNANISTKVIYTTY